ncbi:MAG: hypothetical protein ACRDK3_01260, partial [Actinomycetota bacterium]
LVAWLEGEQLIISTRRAVAAHTKGILRDLGEGVVDDLIAERRAEARREEQESRALRKQLQENRRDDGP